LQTSAKLTLAFEEMGILRQFCDDFELRDLSVVPYRKFEWITVFI
jgi:hypothetical protein